MRHHSKQLLELDSFEFVPFELLVTQKTERGYQVVVTESVAGEASEFCDFDFLFSSLPPYQDTQDIFNKLKELGARLFDELFSGDIQTIYRSGLSIARASKKRLRVRIRIDALEIAVYPWEFLYDQQEDVFLSLSAETSLVRYIPMKIPVRPTMINLPMRVLVAMSSPTDLPALDILGEKKIIENALENGLGQDNIQVRYINQATVSNIIDGVRAFNPHVFHFIGHGAFFEERSWVALETESGESHFLDEVSFRDFFLGISDTRLVVLNACQTGKTSTYDPMMGLAPRLLQRNISAVVAMQYAIPDQAALTLSREFYHCLALGYPVDLAISEARRSMYLVEGDTWDWGTPMLFMRAKEGKLFEISRDESEQRFAIPEPPQPQKTPDVIEFVGRDAEISNYHESLDSQGLALICGMAGVGKTALASVLAHQISEENRIFWHSFHEAEGIDVLIWKLAGFLAHHGEDYIWYLLQNARLANEQLPPGETLVDYFVQALRDQPYCLCFDDFQYIDDDPLVNQLVTRLCAYGNHVKMIITSRRKPPRLRMPGGPSLMGLSPQDAVHLLETKRIHLIDDIRRRLIEVTEGNVAILILAIDALRNTENPERIINQLVEQEDIEYYLLNEIDQQLTPEEHSVMIALAVLLGYSGSRDVIEVLINDRSTRRVLNDLVRRFLIISQSGEFGREYYQHALVQTYFYSLLSRRERKELHQKAAFYYENEELDDLKAAIHLERAEDFERAAQLLTVDIQSFIGKGQSQNAKRILARLAAQSLNPGLLRSVQEALGDLYYFHGELDKALESYQVALTFKSETLHAVAMHRKLGEILVRKGDQEEALSQLSKGYDLLRSQENVQDEKNAIDIIYGTVMLAMGRYDEAIKIAQDSLANPSITESNPSAAADLQDILGKAFFFRGELSRAGEQFQQALELRQNRSSNPQAIIKSYSNLAIIHGQQNQYNEAHQANQAALEIAEEIGDIIALAKIYNNMAADAHEQGEYSEALKYHQQSLKLREKMGSLKEVSISHQNLGDTYRSLERYEEAKSHLNQAVEYARKANHLVGVVIGLQSLAEVYLSMDHLDQARKYCDEALQIGEKISYQIMRPWVLRVLGQIARRESRWKDGRTAFKEAVQLWEDQNVQKELAVTLLKWAQLEKDAQQIGAARSLCEDAIRISKPGNDAIYGQAIMLLKNLDGKEVNGDEKHTGVA